MNFEQLIAPLSPEDFRARFWDRAPVHVRAPEGSDRSNLLDWDGLNRLLAIESHWTRPNIELVMNSRPVEPVHYLDRLEDGIEVATAAKINLFLAMGASLVANSIERIDPAVRRLTDALATRFGARANANLYCSFKGVQAFASHCDLHEVFALQLAGEKRWRVYANRAEAPVSLVSGPGAQDQIDRAKGPVLMDVLLKPGDVLYIPRGFFHDALASSSESLHVSLGVLPHSGRILFRLLEEMAMSEAAFRHYLPDAREEGGGRLAGRLDLLADRVAQLIRSPRMAAAIANAQRGLARPAEEPALPSRPSLDGYARTDRNAVVEEDDEGSALVVGEGRRNPLGTLGDEADWMLSRPAFLAQEAFARYPHRSRAELQALIDLLANEGLVASYQPEI